MRLLFRWCVIVAALNTVVLGSILALSSGRRTTAATDIFHFNEFCELPCWIGITPGKTPLEKSLHIISDFYNSKGFIVEIWSRYYDSADVSVKDNDDNPKFALAISTHQNSNIVASITLYQTILSPQQFLLGDILVKTAAPTDLRLSEGVNTQAVHLMFPYGTVRLPEGFSPETIWNGDPSCVPILQNQKIVSITLRQMPYPKAEWHSAPQAWRGFQHCYNFEVKLMVY